MATYYVKTGGSDAADGLTDGTAWETIAQVNGFTFSSGDVVSFNRGDTWAEMLTVPRTNMTFNAYGSGAEPIITGSGARANAILCTHDGCTFQDLALTAGTAAGFFANDADSLVLLRVESYANATNGFTLNGNLIAVTACDAHDNTEVGFLQSGSYTTPTFVSCTATDNTLDGFRLTGTTTPVISLCSSTSNGTGAGTSANGFVLLGVVGGTVTTISATGNDVHGVSLSNNGGTSCSGIEFDQVGASGNGASSGAVGSGISVAGTTANCDFKRLLAFGNDEAGIVFRGGATLNDLEFSVLYDNARGVWFTASHGVNNTVEHCTIVDNTVAGVALTANGSAAPAVQVKDCILYGNAVGILADADGVGVSHDINFNLYDGHTGATAVVWDEDTYADGAIDTFNGDHGYEAQGIGDVDPLFSDYANNHYMILSGSPAIGNGSGAPAGPSFSGAAPHYPPTRGAYEYTGWWWFPSGGGA